MVDRKYIVEILNKMQNPNNAINIGDVEIVLRSYCTEKGKKEEDINKFIVFFVANFITNPFFTEYYTYALEYYKTKFNIYELSHGSKIILYY